MIRDKVKRNVVDLCEIPEGRPGRPSHAMTLAQAEAVVNTAEKSPVRIRAYILLSLLTGARTEEVRALTWPHVVAFDEERKAWLRAVKALRQLREAQNEVRADAGDEWTGGLVFSTKSGKPLTAHNVRRDFRKVLDRAGLVGREWSPREMRHSFVSVLSDPGVPIEDISRLVGHANTVVTETVYRFQLRPVLLEGAKAMDSLFPDAGEA